MKKKKCDNLANLRMLKIIIIICCILSHIIIYYSTFLPTAGIEEIQYISL